MALEGWTKKRELTIPAAQVGSGGVTSYTPPLKVTATSAKADGSDLRVTTDEAGTSLLTVDVLEALGSGVFWIRVGTTSLSSVSDNTLWLWSGNASATAQTGSGAYDANWTGYWPFEGGSLTDRTANGNDGTAIGSPTTATGQVGDALDFERVAVDDGDAIEADGAALTGTASTMSVWVNPESANDFQGAMTNAHATADEPYFTTGYDSGNLWRARHNSDPSGLDNLGPTTAVSTGTWQHFVAVRDGGTVSLYKDGSLAASESGDLDDLPGDRFRIGSFYRNSQGGTRGFFDGLIDEPQVHSVARDAAWIATEYNATNDPASFLTQGTEQDTAPTFNPAWAAAANANHLVGANGYAA